MAVARKLYYENVRVGDELQPLLKAAIDRVAIARYAGASQDFNATHVDEEYAKRCGFPSVFAHGMLPMGFLGQLCTEWLRAGQVKRLSSRFVKIVWPGDQLTCRGRPGPPCARNGRACRTPGGACDPRPRVVDLPP